jgi:hypothetical protein
VWRNWLAQDAYTIKVESSNLSAPTLKKKKKMIKQVEDSGEILNVHLALQDKRSHLCCESPKCYSVADMKLHGKIYLCYKCLDLLRAWKTNYELAKYFNSKGKIRKLLMVIDELTHPQRKKVIRCTNIYCATTENMTQHHLFPKGYRGGIVGRIGRVPLCRPCHDRVHDLKENGELAAHYNTKEAIRELLASDRKFRVQRMMTTYNAMPKLQPQREYQLAVA